MTNMDLDNNLMNNKTEQIVANETALSQENTVEYPGAASSLKEPLPQTLQPTPLRRRQTGPTAPFDGLATAQVVFMADRVMYYIEELCRRRGAAVDFEYWRKVTKRVLKGLADRGPLVCPARAGSGKSTWITAFLLAACELRLNNDPLADVFSVLLVLQKIESLNGIRDTIADFFPNAPETLVVPLQGWTAASQKAGFCKNKQVTSFDQCRKDNCPFAASCDVLRFGQLAGQAGNRLGQTGCFLGMLALFFPRGQFFFRIADVSLHRHLFGPCGLRRHARHIDDLPRIPAAAGILRYGLVVAHFFHAFNGGVLHWLGVVHQIPKRQVRVFNGCTVLVNDLHGSKPPFSGHAPPDVHIVGGRLHGGAAAVDGIRLGRIQTNLYTSEKELYSPVDAITLPAVNAPDTLCSPFFTSATKEPVMFGSPAFTVVPAAWLLLAPISTRSDAICSHVPPNRAAGLVGAVLW